MIFSPRANEAIRLFGEDFTFQPHPKSLGILSGMALSWTGSRGIVYQVKNSKGRLFALKVFYHAFRNRQIVDSSACLRKIEMLKGMSAAERRIVMPEDRAAKDKPDLQYAVLMPWIAGKTWDQILMQAAATGPPYCKGDAIQCCTDFLETLSQLEEKEVAHTDISSSNVVFQFGNYATELLDLEEVYTPGASRPARTHVGTPNYQHQAAMSTWCAQGDRYAAAVMASEILLLSDQSAARRAAEAGYYAGNCKSPEAQQRFEFAHEWLTREAPEFGELFRVAWFADSLALCPSVRDLRVAAKKAPTGVSLRVFTPASPPEELPAEAGAEPEENIESHVAASDTSYS